MKSTLPRIHLTVLLLLTVCFSACESPQSEQAGSAPEPVATQDETAEIIAENLLNAQRNAEGTRFVMQNYPDLDRTLGYKVQLMTLQAREAEGDEHRGWKMGGTALLDPDAVADPMFGYSLASELHESGATLPDSLFVGGQALVEAEIAVIIGQDLPGPEVSREELEAAVEGIRGAIELISIRMLPASEGAPAPTAANMTADRLSHGGAVLGSVLVAPDDIDLTDETVQATVNGEVRAEGTSGIIMNQDPLGVAHWLANELPKHGLYLRAGDYILTGSLYSNPTIVAGDEATVSFKNLGQISIALGRKDI